METRILVAFALIALLVAFFALLGWVNVSHRLRKRRREQGMRERWLDRRRPLRGETL